MQREERIAAVQKLAPAERKGWAKPENPGVFLGAAGQRKTIPHILTTMTEHLLAIIPGPRGRKGPVPWEETSWGGRALCNKTIHGTNHAEQYLQPMNHGEQYLCDMMCRNIFLQAIYNLI